MNQNLNVNVEKKFRQRREAERVNVYNTICDIFPGLEERKTENQLKGIVTNISVYGCCALLQSEFVPLVGSFVRINIGNHQKIISQVRWVKDEGESVFKIGFRYQV